MTKQLERQLGQAESEIRQLATKMDQLRAEITDGYGNFLKQFIPEGVRKVVTSMSPQITRQLAAEDPSSLQQMRKEIDEVAANAPTTVKNALGSDELWWHRDRDGFSKRSRRYPHRPSKAYEINNYHFIPDALSPVGEILSSVGSMLYKNGYLHHGSGQLGFPNGEVTLPPNLSAALGQYATAVERMLHLESVASRIRDDISRRDAANIWDQL